MQATGHPFEPEIQALAHRLLPKRQPFAENGMEVFHLGTLIQTDHVQVDAVGAFQVGGGEEMRHHRFGVVPGRPHHHH